jgi:hypothetical protein
MSKIADPLWPHFKPLWLDFEKAGNGISVAGGYGLFLKQQYLIGEGTQPIVIPFERWQDAAPRATGDMDLIVGLDLIADKTANRHLLEALEREGFEVSREARGKRWQFFKDLGNNQHVIAELHAPLPDATVSGLKANTFTIKHKPSLGDQGIHGRTNQEAVGSELHPFLFELESVQIAVPNPVTWTVMKLTAAQDTWKRSQDADSDADDRKFHRAQALKHGHDVCRSVAMMTIAERDFSSEVIQEVKNTPQFKRASAIYQDFFSGEYNWANEVLKDQWLAEDLQTIHLLMASWFTP